MIESRQFVAAMRRNRVALRRAARTHAFLLAAALLLAFVAGLSAGAIL